MSGEDHKQALPPGFRLGSYRVARVLGVGGFGVTCLCEHASLGVRAALKEYLPNELAVRDCFKANSTAYIVMDYEEGESLDRILQRLGTLTEGQLKRVLLPVADELRQVHAAGFLHRDIKPSNIFVRRADESPVLLD